MNTPSPSSSSNEPTCQQCGKPIPEGSPRGLCALCLINAVAKTEGPSPADVPSPELDELLAAFPQFESLEPLGAGGMGRVYKARHAHLDRTVALKLLPPAYAADPEWVERFTREARALARLNHPNIVQVHDFGEATTGEGESARKFPFLIMEYVDGVNLRQTLRSGTLTAREALDIVPPLCAALQYAHDQGVLHRDIKPENILLDTQGRVKIADFGLAKLNGEANAGVNLTATGVQLGTAAYMAPEQLEKPHEVDHRADIYSLGVVFYEMLTGELPLGRFLAPSEKAGTDPRLDTIVFRTLEKERDRRFQTATEMKSEVDSVASTPNAATADPDEWMVRCATCGRTVKLSDVGGTRIGAVSIGKRIPVQCSKCGGMREGIVAKLRDLPPGTVPGVPPAAPTTPARWPVALVLTLLLMPFGLFALLILWAGAYHAAGRGGTSLSLVYVLVILLAFAGFIAGLTWLFGRLRRAGWSGFAAGLVLALVLMVLPVGGCVAALAIPTFSRSKARATESRLPKSAEDVVTPKRVPAVGRLPKGSIELLAVSHHPSESEPWWRMDGSPLPAGTFVNTDRQRQVKPGTGEAPYEFAFRATDLPKGTTLLDWKFENSTGWGYGRDAVVFSVPFCVVASFPTKARTATIRAGFGFGEWSYIGSCYLGGAGAFNASHEGVTWKLAYAQPAETHDGYTVSTWNIPRNDDWETGVVALKKDGTEIAAGDVTTMNEQISWVFQLPLSELKEFRLQVRRIKQIEFRGIPLTPSMKMPPAPFASFSLKGMEVFEDEGNTCLRMDSAEETIGDSELYFRTVGMAEPSPEPLTEKISSPSVPGTRRVWVFPKGIDKAVAERIQTHIANEYLNKKIPHYPGSEYPFFPETMADETQVEVFIGARKKSDTAK